MNHRFLSAVLALVLLLGCAGSALGHESDADAEARFAGRTLEGLTAAFMEQHQLSDSQFSVSYYNTATQEYFGRNDTQMMVAASTYKVPLNLYYYQMEASGEIDADAYIPGAGTTLDVAHEQSLVNSNNDISEGMLYHLGRFYEYKQAMLTLFTLTEDEVDPQYFYGNYYCTRMMTDVLRILYDNAEQYADMLALMERAYPENGYFRRDVTEYTIAHKYGSYEGAENDVGIFFTDEPFLLAVYTQHPGGEDLCAQYARLVTDYNVYYAAAHRAEAEAQAAAEEAERLRLEEEAEQARLEAEAAAAAEQAAQQAAAEAAAQEAAAASSTPPDTAPQGGVFETLRWWMIVVALVIACTGGIALRLIFQTPGRYEARMRKKYGRFDHSGTHK